MIFFSNDVIVTGNDQNWYQVLRNDQMITSYHISAKKHIVGVSLTCIDVIFEAFWVFFVFSFHLFKNYKNNRDCIDMELSYYLECSSLAEAGRSGTVAICQANGKFILIIGLWYSEIMITVSYNEILQVNALLRLRTIKFSYSKFLLFVATKYTCFKNKSVQATLSF